MSNSQVETCLQLIRDIEDTIQNAHRGLNPKYCTVNRDDMLVMLQEVKMHLPNAVQQAEDYMKEIDTALKKAETDKTVLIHHANQEVEKAKGEAEQTVKAAQRHAQQILEGANCEAKNMIAAAEKRAEDMLAKAEEDVRNKISESMIMRRAQVAASEKMEEAQREMMKLRGDTFTYLDDMLDYIDRTISITLNQMRAQRQELNEHR